MKYFIAIIACMLFFFSCSEENNRAPVTKDSTIPGQVSNVRAESLPGAIKLTYDLPSGQSLSYVKAECVMKNGEVRQVKATAYQDTLTVEGFGDTSTYTIQLYSVNRSELASKPVSIQARPLTPEFQNVFKTVQLIEGWGGAVVTFKNPNETDLAISLIYVDSMGFWNDGQTFYTKQKSGQFAIRGFKPQKTTFGVYIRDRWNNTTDTLTANLLPRFEKRLDRLKFKEVDLPGDAPYGGWNWVMTNLWDGLVSNPDFDACPGYVTAANGTWPQWMTMDLGLANGVKLSRYRMWIRGGGVGEMFQNQCVKKFELWGSMKPNPDGSWDNSWTFLLAGEITKPSGLPAGQFSDEDRQVIFDGEEFEMPLDVPLVRYIRVKVLETWGGVESFHFVELAFWGQEPGDVPSGGK